MLCSYNPYCSYSCTKSSQGGGHRTLLYGHAILLRHTHSGMVSNKTSGTQLRKLFTPWTLFTSISVQIWSHGTHGSL